jgi:peptide chain release factor 1
VVQIVTLSGSLTDTGEDRVTTVSLGDVVDELLNEHSLSDTGTTEKSDFTTSGVRGEQVDDLDTGLENLGSGRLVDESGSIGVNGQHLDTLDLSTLVKGLTDDGHDSTGW